ncbi:MAG: ChbG/HpnK family deacetylase [Flavobacteriales bacterium]|nr:ChbG/HpnK family deacetylase [Flavobacteriales bacterium]
MKPSGLIVTSDDYGINKSANRGIIAGVKTGVISSVHVLANLVNQADINELIKAIQESGNKCGIALHLNTTRGRALVQKKTAFTKRRKKKYSFKPLKHYRHSRILNSKTEAKNMEAELKAQFDKLADLLSGAENIDAVSSHQNIHLWDKTLSAMVSRIITGTTIPVRSPIRYEKDENPDTSTLRYGTKPLTKLSIKKAGGIIDSISTTKLMLTGNSFSKQKVMRDLVIKSSPRELPVNLSGHWFGQPSQKGMTWFINALNSMNNLTGQKGYTSELLMHLGDSKKKADQSMDYGMASRYEEFKNVTNPAFIAAFETQKDICKTNHGSFRSVLIGDDSIRYKVK